MTFIYSKQNPNDKDIFISCLLYRCERIKCVCKIMARNTSLVFVYQGGDPPCLSCHCLPCNERRQPRCPPTRCLRSRGTWRSGLESAPALRPWGFFSTSPPHFRYQNEKNVLIQRGVCLHWTFLEKNCSGWLQLNFRFGSEMGKKE